MNLASDLVGAKAIACSDDFFASMDCLVNHLPAVFEVDRYTDRGKWMDGWETRRKRSVGEDWAIIELARPGVIVGFDVDTSHFTGNYAPAVSIKGCDGSNPNDPNAAQSTYNTIFTDPDLFCSNPAGYISTPNEPQKYLINKIRNTLQIKF